MEEQLFNLKFASRQLQRQHRNSNKAYEAEKPKVKKAIEKGNNEEAKIHAENAIRKKNEALNQLRLSSRIDAIVSRVETAIRMGMVSRSMTGVVKGMDNAMKELDVAKIALVMDAFEKQCEDMDVKSNHMDGVISRTTSLTTPEDEVRSLIQQVADQHNLKLEERLIQAPVPSTRPTVPVVEEQEGMFSLFARRLLG